MNTTVKLLKYEFLNIIRSRWVFFYSAFLFLLSMVFLYVSGSPSKALVTISSVITVLVPLTSILYTTFYWYNSDRMTELLLSQPIQRKTVLFARFWAMSLSLGAGFAAGVALPFLLRGAWGLDLLWITIFGGFLAIVFCGIGMFIAIQVNDKMRGVGLAFALWFYFVLVHDMIILTVLILAKDYPLDFLASILTALNPIGLTRVVLLVQQDASMLLGHSGALVRETLLGLTGQIAAVGIFVCWLGAPITFAYRNFVKRDL